MKNREIIITAVIAAIIIGGSAILQWSNLTRDRLAEVEFNPDLSLRDLAENNGLLPGELKYRLQHEIRKGTSVDMLKPVKQLPIPEATIRAAIVHTQENENPWRYIQRFVLLSLFFALLLLGLMKQKQIAAFRKWILVVVFCIFGIVLGVSPNPMEAVVKLFKWTAGLQGGPVPVIGTLILFSILSIWGAKLLCGWGCPLGALQETLFNFRLFPKKYHFQFPFVLSLGIRVTALIVFLILLFGGIPSIVSFVLYHHVNYFKVFRMPEMAIVALYSLPVFLVASILMFRPFCQWICPFGLWAWVLEKISLYRIRINVRKCTKCLKCVKACPTQAMKGIYENRGLLSADCWVCGECVEACPTRAISYSLPSNPKS